MCTWIYHLNIFKFPLSCLNVSLRQNWFLFAYLAGKALHLHFRLFSAIKFASENLISTAPLTYLLFLKVNVLRNKFQSQFTLETTQVSACSSYANDHDLMKHSNKNSFIAFSADYLITARRMSFALASLIVKINSKGCTDLKKEICMMMNKFSHQTEKKTYFIVGFERN